MAIYDMMIYLQQLKTLENGVFEEDKIRHSFRNNLNDSYINNIIENE